MSFSVIDHGNDNARAFESRAEAEDKAKNIKMMVNDPSAIEIVQGAYDDYSEYEASEESNPKTEEVEPEVIDHSTDGGTTNAVQPEQTVQEPNGLPERSVSDDPFEWMPGEFIDTIQGTQAINRKGYAVLSQFYDISVESECVVGPEETEFTYARCEATAVGPDGETYKAHGSAHVDRMDGDDPTLLLELADTRATKRVLAIATGVGAVAVEELKNEL